MSTQDNPSSGCLMAVAFSCLIGATIIWLSGCISPHERYMRSRYDDNGRVLNAWYALTKPSHP